jgi:hypothetical protein
MKGDGKEKDKQGFDSSKPYNTDNHRGALNASLQGINNTGPI